VTEPQEGKRRSVLASAVLQELHDAASGDQFTLAWLMERLDRHSFGIILLLLAIVAATPGICVFGGLLIMAIAFQMIIGASRPSFPRWIANRPLPTRRLRSIVPHCIAALRFLERAIRPRWLMPPGITKRVIGLTVMALAARLILVPIPLSNVLPALVIGLISLAYLEEDGLFLSLSLVAGFSFLAVDFGIAWETIHGGRPF